MRNKQRKKIGEKIRYLRDFRRGAEMMRKGYSMDISFKYLFEHFYSKNRKENALINGRFRAITSSVEYEDNAWSFCPKCKSNNYSKIYFCGDRNVIQCSKCRNLVTKILK